MLLREDEEACLAGNARGRHGLAFDPAAASCHIDDVDDAALHDLLSLLHPADDDDGNAHGPGHAPSSSDAASGLHTACQAQLLSQQHLEQERQQQELGQPLAEPVAPVLPTVKPEPLHGPEPGPGPWQGLAAGAGARLPRLRPSSQRSSTSGTSGDGVGEEPDGPPSPCHLERHCGSSTSMPAPPADGATLPGHGLPGLGGPGPACRLQQQRSFPAQMPLAAQLQPLPLQPQAAAPRARVVPKAEAVVDEDGGGSDSDAVAAGGVGQGGEELDAEHYAFGGRPLGASNARANGSAGALKKAPMPHSTIEKHRRDRINHLIEELGVLVPAIDPKMRAAEAAEPGTVSAGARRPKHAVLRDVVLVFKYMQTQLARLGAESAPLSLIAAMSAKPTPSLSPPPPAAPVVVQARLARGSSSGKLQQPLPQQPLPQQQPQVGIFSAGAMASADAVSAPPHQHQHQQQRRQPQHVPHMAPSPSPSPSPRAMAPPLPAALLAVLAPVPSLPGFVPMEGMGGAPLTMAPGPAAGHAWPAAAGVSAMVMASPRSLATAPSSAAVAAFEEEAEAAAEQAAVDETEVQVSRGRRADSWQVRVRCGERKDFLLGVCAALDATSLQLLSANVRTGGAAGRGKLEADLEVCPVDTSVPRVLVMGHIQRAMQAVLSGERIVPEPPAPPTGRPPRPQPGGPHGHGHPQPHCVQRVPGHHRPPVMDQQRQKKRARQGQ